MTTARPRGFAPWRPQSKTQPLLDQVLAVLDTYRDSLPLTGRQIFYRLVATIDYPKEESSYKSLLELINRARRAQIIPMDSIRDDGAKVEGNDRYSDKAEFLENVMDWARDFPLDLQQYQPLHLVLVCEAQGMMPQLMRVARPFGVPVRSSGGFDSTTVKHELGKYCAEQNKPVRIIHVGDLDPSGEHIHLSLGEDVAAFASHYGGEEVDVVRCAVTAEQQAIYDLPTAPPKKTDKRSFAHSFTVQAEALPPDTLAEIVRQALEENTDLYELNHARDLQAEAREELVSRLGEILDQFG